MNPFSDALLFMTAQTNDYMTLGSWRFLILTVFYLFLGTSLILAFANWRQDPAQRTGRHVAIWAIRVLVGCMWFEGMLWKLPLFSDDNGLHYWMEQMAGRAAFALHRDLVAHLLLPAFVLVNPLIFLAELGFAASLILGLGVRLAALLAIPFVLNLWLGIYLQRPGDPAEWSWSYMFLAMLHGFFILDAAGRSLGADAWLRRNLLQLVKESGVLGRLVRLAT